MSGRHRGVGGKDRGSRNDLKRSFEINMVIDPDLSQSLQTCEGRMALIHMQNLGLNFHGRQGLHAPDSQKHLLGQTNLVVAGVQSRSDFTRSGGVFGNIGIQ